MKRFSIILFYLMCILFLNARDVAPEYIELARTGTHHSNRYDVSIPKVSYHFSGELIIDFEDIPCDSYTVIISSPFTDVDYYVTSSYTTIPLVVDGYSDYNIIIETSDGDVFEGTLAASDYTTTATF